MRAGKPDEHTSHPRTNTTRPLTSGRSLEVALVSRGGSLGSALREHILAAVLPKRWYRALRKPYGDRQQRELIAQARPRVCMACERPISKRGEQHLHHLWYMPEVIRLLLGVTHWHILHPLQVMELDRDHHDRVPTGRNKKGRLPGWTFMATRFALGAHTMTRHLWRWKLGKAMVVAYYGAWSAVWLFAAWTDLDEAWWRPVSLVGVPLALALLPWVYRHFRLARRKPKVEYEDYRDRIPDSGISDELARLARPFEVEA